MDQKAFGSIRVPGTGLPDSSAVKNNSPAMQETQEPWVGSLGQKDPLEEEITTHSSILTWKILWTEEPGGVAKSNRIG